MCGEIGRRAVDKLDTVPNDPKMRKLYASEGVVQLKVLKGGQSSMTEQQIEIFTANG